MLKTATTTYLSIGNLYKRLVTCPDWGKQDMETNNVSFYSDSLQFGASDGESLVSAKFSTLNEIAARAIRITVRIRDHYTDQQGIHE